MMEQKSEIPKELESPNNKNNYILVTAALSGGYYHYLREDEKASYLAAMNPFKGHVYFSFCCDSNKNLNGKSKEWIDEQLKKKLEKFPLSYKEYAIHYLNDKKHTGIRVDIEGCKMQDSLNEFVKKIFDYYVQHLERFYETIVKNLILKEKNKEASLKEMLLSF